MSRSPLRFGPLRFLLLLTLLAAAGLAWMWVDEHAQPRSLAWIAPKALPPDIKVPISAQQAGTAANDPARFAAILERPVFAPDRRPPPPPPAPTPPPPPDPLANIKIHGIFSGEKAGILAVVDGKSRRVKINETIGNWTLKRLDGRDITFARGEEERKLALAYARLNAPVPVPAPTPPQPPKASGPPELGRVPAPPTQVPAAGVITQNVEDQIRVRLQRRNEFRAARGLPPIPE